MRYAHSLGSMSSAKMDSKLKKPLDYINLVLQIIEHLLSWPGPENEDSVKMPFLVIESTNKLKRAYIIKLNQIVSFSFPFQICSNKNSLQYELHVRYRDIDVTPEILSRMRVLFNDYVLYKDQLSYSAIASSQDIQDTDMLVAIRMFEMLMLAEPAYVRYDYDPKGTKGVKHPLFHFDYNFIKENQYKIGLHSCINFSQLEDMICIDTDSWYVAKYRESLYEKSKRLKAILSKSQKRRSKGGKTAMFKN